MAGDANHIKTPCLHGHIAPVHVDHNRPVGTRKLTATIGAAVSAADRKVSPASTPSPPEYVGSAGESAISMEKYAIDRWDTSGDAVWTFC